MTFQRVLLGLTVPALLASCTAHAFHPHACPTATSITDRYGCNANANTNTNTHIHTRPKSKLFPSKRTTADAPTSFDSLHKLRGGALSLSLSPTALAIAESIAPKMGVVTSTALYFAPLTAVLAAIKSGDLGDLNPLPLAIMSVVSISWLAYGLTSRNPYVTLSNIFGCIAAVGYVVGVLPLLGAKAASTEGKKTLRTTQSVVIGGAGIVLSLWTYLGLSNLPLTQISEFLGFFASGLFIIFSASPLSTISTVIATRDSSSILGSLTAAQCINTSLWSVYGLAVKDKFVWGPNFIGLGLGLVQLVLKILFPAKTKAV